MPEYYQAVQTKSPAPAVKIESDLKKPFQFQVIVDGNCPRDLSCSTNYEPFNSRSQTQDSYIQGQTKSQKRSAQYLKQLALQEA